MATQTKSTFDVAAIRAQFPALHQTVHDEQPLVYLDNAATSQKPQSVIDRLNRYYSQENSNVHRGVHTLSQQATDAFEDARQSVARFIGASDDSQLIFTRGTTEAINLVARTFGRQNIGAGDEVLITEMEHHSNIVPWQMLCEEKGAKLQVAPVSDKGELQLDAFASLLSDRTKLVALTHISNSLGTINPVADVSKMAHEHGAVVLVDGAQSAPHLPVDVEALGVDFYCFSGHKMFGPTGIGGLWAKRKWLEGMPPYQGGGDMIDEVTFEKTTYADLPHKFEAGTPHIAGVIGFGEAARFMLNIDREAALEYETELLQYGTERLQSVDGLRLIGTAERKASVLSFLIGDIHPYDAGTILDKQGIAVRTGHHCTQPLMKRFGIPGTVRASLAVYNTKDDIDRLVEGIERVKSLFG